MTKAHGDVRVTTDQGGAKWKRKPGGAVGTMLPGGVEGGRSQGVAN